MLAFADIDSLDDRSIDVNMLRIRIDIILRWLRAIE